MSKPRNEEEAKRGRLKKYKKIPQEWRYNVMARTPDELRKVALKLVMNNLALKEAEELDQDLIALKESLKVAREQYVEGKKDNDLRFAFVIDLLREQGCTDVPTFSDFLKEAEKARTNE